MKPLHAAAFAILCLAVAVAARLHDPRELSDRALPTDESVTPESPEFADHAIEGQYIVVFKDEIADIPIEVQELIEMHGIEGETKILWHYHSALSGFVVQGVRDNLLQHLNTSSAVKYVEQDVKMILDGIASDFEQHGPPNWGLDRIDEVVFFGNGLNNRYKYDQTGKDVTVFVLDTGIRSSHYEFVEEGGFGRVVCAYDAFANKKTSGCEDRVGHGTFVSSGVAKHALVMAIKVFNDQGFGSAGSVLAGIEHVHRLKVPDKPAIANLSFGSFVKLQSIEEAIGSLLSLGVVVTASSGNDGIYACQKSPGYMKDVITVAATTFEDQMAYYSNIGVCTTILAPGDRITAAWNHRNTDRATISGTSAAAAHTAGVVALLLEQYPTMSPDEVKRTLKMFAEADIVEGIPDYSETKNLLLNMAALLLVN